MSCKPHDILALAENLNNAVCVDEAQNRCVVSRAYYSAHLLTRATFTPGNRRSHESSHDEVIRRAIEYGKQMIPGNTAAAQIGKLLPKLKAIRNEADYDMDLSFDAERASQMVARVKHLFQLSEEVERKRSAGQAQAQAQAQA